MSKHRILLTGASGLLGRAIFRILKEDIQWAVTGLAFTRCTGELKKVDITKKEEVSTVINEVKPDVIIHSAAERRPDIVEKQADATKLLNVGSTQVICEEAAKLGVPVLYVSTDYVFDGKNAPYKETDQPNPLNKYGQSKLEGEKVTMDVSKNNMILRVPILYGEVENLDESAVTVLFHKVLDTEKPCSMSHYERRYPTHADDVAAVIKDLLALRLQDTSLSGVFHWSGDENMTKYDMCLAMGEAFHLATGHIQGDAKPATGAQRPYNANLATTKLESLGICHRRPFKQAIGECLKPFLKHKQ